MCRIKKIRSGASRQGFARPQQREIGPACTAGRFNWFYDIDETIFVIEGGVVIKDEAGNARRLNAGDTIFFPKRASAEWNVETYIRKIAFCRTPLPWPLAFAKRGIRSVKRRMNIGGGQDSGPAMFQRDK